VSCLENHPELWNFQKGGKGGRGYEKEEKEKERKK
jgi:hypothetical protein